MKRFWLAAQVLVLGFIGSTFAAPFQNGSFEIGTLTADPCNVALPVASTAITGWTVVSGNIDYLTPTCWQPSHGTRSLDLVGNGSVGGIQQTFDTVPGQTYEVSFDLAGNPSPNFPPQVKNLTVTVDGTPHNFTFDTSSSTVAVMGWTAHSFQFVATGSSSTISFVSNMTPSTFAGAALDNVQVLVLATAPTVATTTASGITAASATLNGTVSSNGTATTVTFQYGPTLDYGFTWSAVQSPLAPGASNVAVSATLAGLDCNTLYHFRAVATNGAGTTNGANASFTTAACPAKSIVLGRDLSKPLALVFLTTVRGAAPTGTVRFTDTLEPAALAACSAVALSGSGDARSAACQTLFSVAGMHRITATYSGDGANAPGTSNTFEYPVGYSGPALNVDLNQHGLTGSWYEPATSGQGLAVEVFPDQAPGQGQAFVSWFTFDPATGGAERQRWYTLQGPMVSGASTAALTIYQNAGGNFNAPPATTAQAVGTATLSFDSCVSGQLAYSFTGGRSGTIRLTRLLPNVTCAVAAPYPTDGDFSLSGSWYAGAATSGQGFTAELAPNANAFFLSWFTYMPNGASAGAAGQRWYTAQGAFTPGLRTIPVQLYETTGGVFDTETPPGQHTVAVGSGSMTFHSCAAASFSYAFTGGSSSGLAGTLTLGRVGPMPPGCTQ